MAEVIEEVGEVDGGLVVEVAVGPVRGGGAEVVEDGGKVGEVDFAVEVGVAEEFRGEEEGAGADGEAAEGGELGDGVVGGGDPEVGWEGRVDDVAVVISDWMRARLMDLVAGSKMNLLLAMSRAAGPEAVRSPGDVDVAVIDEGTDEVSGGSAGDDGEGAASKEGGVDDSTGADDLTAGGNGQGAP